MERLRKSYQKLSLCVQLSEFAYTSANPSASISTNDDEAGAALRKKMIDLRYDPHDDGFERFASKSWWLMNFETQKRWFRSQSFLYLYHDPKADDAYKAGNAPKADDVSEAGVDKIVVAFRGTWLDPSAEREWHVNEGTSSS